MRLPGFAHFVTGAVLAVLLTGPARAAGACSFEVVGTWRQLDAPQSSATLLNFTADGWANVLNGPGEQSAQDIAAQVRYRLEPAREPRRIDFEARRGNDVFAAGTTGWEITDYSDDSFTARPVDSVEGTQHVWQRVQTHRYFLTFAARNGAAGDSAAFVMWTTLDGHRMELDGLGSVQQGGVARFGKIPFSLAKAFARQGDPAHDVMMRIELSAAEYRRTQAVQRAWAKRRSDPGSDPDTETAVLIETIIESLNGCVQRIRHTHAHAMAGAMARDDRRSGDLVRSLRQENDRRHVSDKAFPALWKPAELS